MALLPQTFDKPLAWVCETFENNGVTEVRVVREGMSREEIQRHFTPLRGRRGEHGYNRKSLIKSIIYEAYLEVVEGGVRRDRDNIRGFWYERIMYTLLTVMGESGDSANIDVIASTINEAWKDLVEDGLVSYRAMNIYSEKEDLYAIEVVKDSPYPGVIVQVEKASLYGPLHDLSSIYEISFCAAGGQDSRAAAMAYAYELEQKGIDLSQGFTVFSFCDFDPEGWDIPDAFVSHLKLRIPGDIQLIRLGVLREQLGESVIKFQAVPYSLNAETSGARQAKRSKYERFIGETGGLFLPDAHGEMTIPGKVELNIYSEAQIRDRIIDGLCQHLDGFAYQVRELRELVSYGYDRAWGETWESLQEAVHEVYSPYYEAIEDRQHDLGLQKKQMTQDEDNRIAELRAEIERLEEVKREKTGGLDESLDRLGKLRSRIEAKEETERHDLSQEIDSDMTQEEILSEIEDSGWHAWADELGVNGYLNAERLAQFGKDRERVRWLPTHEDRKAIKGWIADKANVGWAGDPQGPDETPEQMIADALGYDI